MRGLRTGVRSNLPGLIQVPAEQRHLAFLSGLNDGRCGENNPRAGVDVEPVKVVVASRVNEIVNANGVGAVAGAVEHDERVEVEVAAVYGESPPFRIVKSEHRSQVRINPLGQALDDDSLAFPG